MPTRFILDGDDIFRQAFWTDANIATLPDFRAYAAAGPVLPRKGVVPAPPADGVYYVLSTAGWKPGASLDVNGKLPASMMPDSSIEVTVTVANQASRYALTTAAVQAGDRVKQTDDGSYWTLVSEADIGTAIGWLKTSTPSWAEITGKPTTLSGYGITPATAAETLAGAAVSNPVIPPNMPIRKIATGAMRIGLVAEGTVPTGVNAIDIQGFRPDLARGATGNSAMNVGNLGHAPGVYSLNFGYNGTAGGSYSTNIGSQGRATNSSSVNVGCAGNVIGVNSTNVGASGQIFGQHSCNFGYAGKADGDDSISIGDRGEATFTQTVNIGAQGRARGGRAINIGFLGSALDNSVNIGNNALAGGGGTVNTVNVGTDGQVNGVRSSSFGYAGTVMGDESINVGAHGVVQFLCSVNVGNFGNTNGTNATNVGAYGVAGSQSINIGYNGTSGYGYGSSCVNVGNQANAAGIGAISIGSYGSALGDASSNFGYAGTCSAGGDNINLGAFGQANAAGTVNIGVHGIASGNGSANFGSWGSVTTPFVIQLAAKPSAGAPVANVVLRLHGATRDVVMSCQATSAAATAHGTNDPPDGKLGPLQYRIRLDGTAANAILEFNYNGTIKKATIPIA